jgi:glycosidase
MKKLIIFLILISGSVLWAQKVNVNLKRVEPPYWFTGMNNSHLQLLVYGDQIALAEVTINSNSFKLQKVNKTDNPNYLFLDVEILPDALPGSYTISFKYGKKPIIYNYELKAKSNLKRGFSSKDLIYLIMPDRFANGNPLNDNDPGMSEQADRTKPNGRHGGDIQGVINRLDYIQDLGITTLWLNPTLENNNPSYSYHGYAITDFYKTDPRHGSNSDYIKLSDELHQRNMKLVMDMIFNHSSINHWWIKDLPAKDWLNTGPDFRSNFRGSTIPDIHASQSDLNKMITGWFDANMPDLNQNNPYLAAYLIQNSIWWIETAGLDGIRMDTQPYPYKEFMSEWAKYIHEEYPDITLLGETWLQQPSITAYFSGNSPISGDYNSNLDCVTDFPLYYSTRDAFNQADGWDTGLANIYYTFAQDFLYGNAYNNVIFLDNHDLDRYYTSVGKDIDKFKMGLTLLFTARGIPMLYYGTELMNFGSADQGHGIIRPDFPGGWTEDKIDAFKEDGRNKDQNELFNFIKTLAGWRKNNKAVTEGKMMHFVPENNVYVYFRYTDNEAVMVLFNNHNKEERTVDPKRFEEILKGYSKGKFILTNETIDLTKPITIGKKSALIIELIK